jgi:hypothetical protein
MSHLEALGFTSVHANPPSSPESLLKASGSAEEGVVGERCEIEVAEGGGSQISSPL